MTNKLPKNNKVEKALEELKNQLEIWEGVELGSVRGMLVVAARNLVKALEAEKKQLTVTFQTPDQPELGFNSPSWSDVWKEEPKIDIKEERVDPVSIWKDGDELKELDKRNEQFLVRLKDGRVIKPILSNILTNDRQIDKNIKEATTLTDFVNSIEQMQKDIEELKQKLGNV